MIELRVIKTDFIKHDDVRFEIGNFLTVWEYHYGIILVIKAKSTGCVGVIVLYLSLYLVIY
jgi:hypothetical protein